MLLRTPCKIEPSETFMSRKPTSKDLRSEGLPPIRGLLDGPQDAVAPVVDVVWIMFGPEALTRNPLAIPAAILP
jgi:hypothetical protein